MKSNKFLKIALFSAVAIGFASCPAFSQQNDEVQALKQRMNSLESKMDALIDLMQKQQSGQPAQTATNAAKVSGNLPEGYVPGMFLDVFEPVSTALRLERDERAVPTGTPAASVAISPSSVVSYAELLKHPETKRFAVENRNDIPSIVLSGYLNIIENGKHTLGIEMTDNTYAPACDAKLIINDKLVASKYMQDRENFASASAGAKLTAGLYSFKIFFECEGGLPVGYDKKSIAFVMAGPNDRAPKAVPADRLLIKQ